MILTTTLFAQIGITVNTFSSMLTSGQSATVSWSVTGTVPATVNFDLLDGTNSFANAPLVAGILQGANPYALSFVWTVPNVPSGSAYFIRVGTPASGYTFSGAFGISGVTSQNVKIAPTPPTTFTPTISESVNSTSSVAPVETSSISPSTTSTNTLLGPGKRYVAVSVGSKFQISKLIFASYFLIGQ